MGSKIKRADREASYNADQSRVSMLQTFERLVPTIRTYKDEGRATDKKLYAKVGKGYSANSAPHTSIEWKPERQSKEVVQTVDTVKGSSVWNPGNASAPTMESDGRMKKFGEGRKPNATIDRAARAMRIN